MVTSGAKYPTLGETISESPWSDNTWVAPTNIYADDAATAYVTAPTFDAPDQTYVLKATGFDFSAIPDNATILGVICRVNAWHAKGSGSLDLCQLLDTSKAKVGTNQCATSVPLTTDDTTIITKGADNDLWENGLTPAWVKSSNFGVALGMLATAANADVFIDYVTLEIYYSTPSGNIYNESPADSFSSTPVCSDSPQVDFFPSLSAFLSPPALSRTVAADLVGEVSLASTPAAVMAAIADFLLSLSLSSDPVWSAIGGSDFYNTVTFTSGPALSDSAFKDAFGSLSLSSTPVFLTMGAADFLAVLTLLSNPAFAPSANLGISVVLTLLSNPTFSAIGGSDFFNSIALASDPAVAAAAFKEAFPSLSLPSVPALSIASQADLLAEILMTSSPGYSAMGGFDFIGSIILASGGTITTVNDLPRSVLAIGAKQAAMTMARRGTEATKKQAPGALRRESQ